jgi:hypothetical protein
MALADAGTGKNGRQALLSSTSFRVREVTAAVGFHVC